jgi:integrase
VKNGRAHDVPLSAQALAILARQPRRNSSEFIFAERGFNDWDRAKQELDQRLGFTDWRLHDLRRTCATMMAEIGVLPHIMRAALQRWADHLDQITS